MIGAASSVSMGFATRLPSMTKVALCCMSIYGGDSKRRLSDEVGEDARPSDGGVAPEAVVGRWRVSSGN